MIYWEAEALNDREKIYAFLYHFNPTVADKTDDIIVAKVEDLLQQPLMGVQRSGISGRLLIIPEVSLIVSDWIDGADIRVMRVLHQKQQFP